MVSHMFADFGADVIKVEQPGKGDDLRNWQVNDVAHWWAVYSRNKRSIALNLKEEEGLKPVSYTHLTLPTTPYV